MNKPVWTTADGIGIEYANLEDSHLLNILKDGYRNGHIEEEAKRRGFDVPVRPVDELSISEHMKWLESFSSCAISGNKEAEKMANLWEENRELYLLKLNQIIKNNEQTKIN